MTKKQRIKIIEQIITENEVSTQEELTELLLSKGLDVSQSTISRDINELNLIKVEGFNKKFKYVKLEAQSHDLTSQTINLFKQVTLSMTIANNLIVIKTLIGSASSVGGIIDKMHMPQVLGTVAGDDTLLVVAKTSTDAEIIVRSLRAL